MHVLWTASQSTQPTHCSSYGFGWSGDRPIVGWLIDLTEPVLEALEVSLLQVTCLIYFDIFCKWKEQYLLEALPTYPHILFHNWLSRAYWISLCIFFSFMLHISAVHLFLLSCIWIIDWLSSVIKTMFWKVSFMTVQSSNQLSANHDIWSRIFSHLFHDTF